MFSYRLITINNATEEDKSKTRLLNNGLSRGSVLVLLLFNLYTNKFIYNKIEKNIILQMILH